MHTVMSRDESRAMTNLRFSLVLTYRMKIPALLSTVVHTVPGGKYPRPAFSYSNWLVVFLLQLYVSRSDYAEGSRIHFPTNCTRVQGTISRLVEKLCLTSFMVYHRELYDATDYSDSPGRPWDGSGHITDTKAPTSHGCDFILHTEAPFHWGWCRYSYAI